MVNLRCHQSDEEWFTENRTSWFSLFLFPTFPSALESLSQRRRFTRHRNGRFADCPSRPPPSCLALHSVDEVNTVLSSFGTFTTALLSRLNGLDSTLPDVPAQDLVLPLLGKLSSTHRRSSRQHSSFSSLSATTSPCTVQVPPVSRHHHIARSLSNILGILYSPPRSEFSSFLSSFTFYPRSDTLLGRTTAR